MIKPRYQVENTTAIQLSDALYTVYNDGVRIGYIEKQFWEKTWEMKLFNDKKDIRYLVTFQKYNNVRQLTRQIISDDETQQQ